MPRKGNTRHPLQFSICFGFYDEMYFNYTYLQKFDMKFLHHQRVVTSRHSSKDDSQGDRFNLTSSLIGVDHSVGDLCKSIIINDNLQNGKMNLGNDNDDDDDQ